ncbi:hypothetical protein AB0L41_06525 [Amycolatopsis mediterranei]|uniref:hypothetical protein n=1 Tax=Amycolatopsis mediterranei TaxID=33910 RepID=UPI00343E2EFC
MLGIVRPDPPATRLLLTCPRSVRPAPAGELPVPVDGEVVATFVDTRPAGRRAVPELAREAE